MKRFLLILLLVKFSALAEMPVPPEKIADAIYIIEGGAKTRFPYGIKSIDTKGDKSFARKICINTVRNNYGRWQNAGRPGKYLDFLADRYCPPSADPVGNRNWKRNIRAYVKEF